MYNWYYIDQTNQRIKIKVRIGMWEDSLFIGSKYCSFEECGERD